MESETSRYRSPPQVLVHFYRAAVQHSDVWRTRLDATTNWAVITTAAVITFAFGSQTAPHFVVLLALLFDTFFLLMESRRYQVYHLWQRRVRVMNRAMVVPALKKPENVDSNLVETLLEGLAADLGHTVPTISIVGALGYRLRRSYGLLMTLALLTWLLKLYIHPEVAMRLADLSERAMVGLIPGLWVMGGVAFFYIACSVLAIRAPTERMESWVEKPTPLGRIMPQKLHGPETGEDMIEGLLFESGDES